MFNNKKIAACHEEIVAEQRSALLAEGTNHFNHDRSRRRIAALRKRIQALQIDQTP